MSRNLKTLKHKINFVHNRKVFPQKFWIAGQTEMPKRGANLFQTCYEHLAKFLDSHHM